MGTSVHASYLCRHCNEGYKYDLSYDGGEFLCPKCHKKLVYFGNSVIDNETNKCISSYWEATRETANPDELAFNIPTPVPQPIVTCPYCNSTDTKKISLTSKAVNTALFGFLGTKRHKQWHCNRCGSDW